MNEPQSILPSSPAEMAAYYDINIQTLRRWVDRAGAAVPVWPKGLRRWPPVLAQAYLDHFGKNE